jgi:hypothetical protein
MMAAASIDHLVMNPQATVLHRDSRSSPNQHVPPRPLARQQSAGLDDDNR